MRVGWVFLAIVIEKMLVAAFQEALTKRFRPDETPEKLHLQRVIQQVVFKAELTKRAGGGLDVLINVQLGWAACPG